MAVVSARAVYNQGSLLMDARHQMGEEGRRPSLRAPARHQFVEAEEGGEDSVRVKGSREELSLTGHGSI